MKVEIFSLSEISSRTSVDPDKPVPENNVASMRFVLVEAGGCAPPIFLGTTDCSETSPELDETHQEA